MLNSQKNEEHLPCFLRYVYYRLLFFMIIAYCVRTYYDSEFAK